MQPETKGPMIAALALGGVLVLESGAALLRHRTRSSLFAEAARRATELGRPLVVVGDPDAGLHTRLVRAYGCGDVCVDLAGCPACPVALAADITRPLPFPSGSAVVYVSCVLEYVPDLEAAYAELLRVAGDPKNLYVVTVQPWTLTAHFYPHAHWAGWAQGGRVAMAPVPTWRKVLFGAGLLGLAAYATMPLWRDPAEGAASELPATGPAVPLPEP